MSNSNKSPQPVSHINAKTDRNRRIYLEPVLSASDKNVYLLYDAARRAYKEAFGRNIKDDDIHLFYQGSDAEHLKFVVKSTGKRHEVVLSPSGANDNRFVVRIENNSSPKSMFLSSQNNTNISHSVITSKESGYYRNPVETLNLSQELMKNTLPSKELYQNSGSIIKAMNIPTGTALGFKDTSNSSSNSGSGSNKIGPGIEPLFTQIIIIQNGSLLTRFYQKLLSTDNEGDNEGDDDGFIQVDVKFLASNRDNMLIIPNDIYYLFENVGPEPVAAISIYSPVITYSSNNTNDMK